MKNKIMSFLLTTLIICALIPAMPQTVSAAGTYRTENVTVPDGYGYHEVSTVDEFHGALNQSQPSFIRLTNDIEISSTDVKAGSSALIYMVVNKSTVIDFNGHTIRGTINAAGNQDNKIWSTVTVQLTYGMEKDFTFRLVDSVGGGGVSLWADTVIDGPTTALRIFGISMLRVSSFTEDRLPYLNDGVEVYIDGGTYNIYTKSQDLNDVLDPLRYITDSSGSPLWSEMNCPFTRAAVGLANCKATVTNGHFTTDCPTDGRIESDAGQRYLAALGLADSYTVSNLKISGGTFDGEAYAVYFYNYSDIGASQPLPVLNGGTYKGGIMLCSVRATYWKKRFGIYELNSTSKNWKIRDILHYGARLYLDGTAADSSSVTLETIGWPHQITITSGADITEKIKAPSAMLINYTGTAYVRFNMQPSSLKLEQYIRTIRNGKDFYIWNEEKSTRWQPVTGQEYYYKVEIPAEDRAGTGTYHIVAVFGDQRVESEPFEIQFLDFSDHDFTYGPEVRARSGDEPAYILFNYNYPEDLKEWALWYARGEFWIRVDISSFLSPDYNPDHQYRIPILSYFDTEADEVTCYMTLEYETGTADTYTVESNEFKVTKDMVGEPVPQDTESPEDTSEAVITPPEGSGPEGSILPFTDVLPEDMFYNSVCWAYFVEPQVTTGKTATLFGPYDTVTRGQAVTFLWRALGCPEPKGDPEQSKFVDLTASYYRKAVQWAVENGITKGVDSTHFNPDGTLSTAHMATFLFRTLGVGEDGWYEPAGWWVHDIGLQDFTGLATDPKIECPRYCTVMMLQYTVGYSWPPEN